MRIETERLVLRRITVADLEEFIVVEAPCPGEHVIDESERARVVEFVRASRRQWKRRGMAPQRSSVARADICWGASL
jgi:hypothetical protein